MLEQLAAEIDANRPAAPNHGYPAWLRDKVVAATAESVASGRSLSRTARRLGLNADTLRRWRAGTPQVDSGFRQVLVAEPDPVRRFRLRAPSGHEVDNLELSDVVALLRELS